ncbi:hypothetical protein ACKXGD_19015, partial [Enterococcus lactis]
AVWSNWLGAVMKANPDNFRAFGPDESMSNRLFGVFAETNRQWMEDIMEPNDQYVAPEGRLIDSQLSEHQAEGWLEGYV